MGSLERKRHERAEIMDGRTGLATMDLKSEKKLAKQERERERSLTISQLDNIRLRLVEAGYNTGTPINFSEGEDRIAGILGKYSKGDGRYGIRESANNINTIMVTRLANLVGIDISDVFSPHQSHPQVQRNK